MAIERATVQDKRLSWEARGLLVYLLSLPADWDIRVSHLQTEGDAGRDALRRMLRELQKYGYVSGVGRESQERSGGGRFGQTEIRVYESPKLNLHHSEASPSPENPSTVSPSPDSPSPGKASPYKIEKLQRRQATNQTPTPRARSRARPSAARAARAGVGESSALSRLDFKTQCLPWAEAKKAAGAKIDAYAVARARWRDGTADDEIAAWLEGQTPEAVTRSLQTPTRAQMGFRAALIHVRSILDVNPMLDIPGCVSQLDVSEETRAQLLSYDFSKRSGAVAASA